MSMLDQRELGPSTKEIRDGRRWFVGLGVVLVVLGIVATVAAFAATLATVLFFGVVLLIAGVMQIAHAASGARWRGGPTHLMGGLLYALIGGLIVFDPVAAGIGLTLLLAAFFIVGGVLKLMLGMLAESGWFAFSGLINLVLGVLVAMGLPETGTWVIGLFLGIELLSAGLALILAASAMRPSSQLDV